MNVAQVIVSVPLFLFLAFGIGFIINMLIKTTWLPVYVYLGVLTYVIIQLGKISWIDVVVLTAGFIGAILSGWTIKTLRRKGYSMF